MSNKPIIYIDTDGEVKEGAVGDKTVAGWESIHDLMQGIMKQTSSPTFTGAEGMLKLNLSPGVNTDSITFGSTITGLWTGEDLSVDIFMAGDGSASGNMVLQFKYSSDGTGDTFGSTSFTSLSTIAVPGVLNEIFTATFTILGTNLLAGDTLAVNVTRLGADAGDTYTGEVGLICARTKHGIYLQEVQ